MRIGRWLGLLLIAALCSSLPLGAGDASADAGDVDFLPAKTPEFPDDHHARLDGPASRPRFDMCPIARRGRGEFNVRALAAAAASPYGRRLATSEPGRQFRTAWTAAGISWQDALANEPGTKQHWAF